MLVANITKEENYRIKMIHKAVHPRSSFYNLWIQWMEKLELNESLRSQRG